MPKTPFIDHAPVHLGGHLAVARGRGNAHQFHVLVEARLLAGSGAQLGHDVLQLLSAMTFWPTRRSRVDLGHAVDDGRGFDGGASASPSLLFAARRPAARRPTRSPQRCGTRDMVGFHRALPPGSWFKLETDRGCRCVATRNKGHRMKRVQTTMTAAVCHRRLAPPRGSVVTGAMRWPPGRRPASVVPRRRHPVQAHGEMSADGPAAKAGPAAGAAGASRGRRWP